VSDNKLVTVCNRCFTEECFLKKLCCGEHETAGTIDLPEWELIHHKRNREGIDNE
jgi:hypothetical protein